MSYGAYAMVFQGLVVLAMTSSPALSATFEVADEDDGPMCWLHFEMANQQSLAVFSAKGRGGKTVEVLLEDPKDTGSLSKVPESFDLAFQFADGTHQSYHGTISEYFGEPYAEAKASLLKSLAKGQGFKLDVTGLGTIAVKDTLSRKTYDQFVKCTTR